MLFKVVGYRFSSAVDYAGEKGIINDRLVVEKLAGDACLINE
ncbi:MAG: hypothetical protein RIC95_13290 [Vicingaceae bacterium]